ncbi:MAG: hypothetical protein Q8Q76_12950 [Methylotenera sp.]|nr:hypothetical protein [Methylotenera sp.]
MQPFDGGVFDKRYEDIFALAIKDADLEPYRVDQDPKVSIPIQDIETGISDSRICFAEITLDNPNVWFELGFAIAKGKDVVIVCSAERTAKFPFDIQHRSVIRYDVASTSDFDKLKSQITSKIKAYLQKEETLPKLSELLATSNEIDGLEQHEIVCLAAIAENLDYPDSGISPYQIKNDMEKSGFTKIAATLAIKGLLEKRLISQVEIQEWNSEPYQGYKFTENGWGWVLKNQGKFLLKKINPLDNFDDNIPF